LWFDQRFLVGAPFYFNKCHKYVVVDFILFIVLWTATGASITPPVICARAGPSSPHTNVHYGLEKYSEQL
jgi:hypothetical protein